MGREEKSFQCVFSRKAGVLRMPLEAVCEKDENGMPSLLPDLQSIGIYGKFPDTASLYLNMVRDRLPVDPLLGQSQSEALDGPQYLQSVQMDADAWSSLADDTITELKTLQANGLIVSTDVREWDLLFPGF